MRLLLGLFALVCAAAVITSAQAQTSATSASRKKKNRKKRSAVPPPPRVTAAIRAASLDRVSTNLETPGYFQQTGAMVPFFELTHRATSGDTRTPIHILHFGDSHTAADEWTGALRLLFQQKFGNGGSGYSLAGYPFKGYRRLGERVGETIGWHSEGLRTGAGDGFFGLGGVSISTERPGQSVFIETECEHVEVYYLRQPGGGEVALDDSGLPIQTFSTAGELGPGFFEYIATPGHHRFVLRTLQARPVRLFGWAADNRSGITYESLGINGAEASLILKWDEAMLASCIERRDPALIVLAYGTNEAGDKSWTQESYQAMFSTLLARLRKAAPVASILVVGPPDRFIRTKAGWRRMEQIDRIVEAQQQAARENRCAFWDTRERMGGSGSMKNWVYSGLAQGDYVHFTASGYQRLAEALFADIIQQYDIYSQTRFDVRNQESHGDTSTNR